uniref:Uncharacterized protein n=1 Tax=Chlamydomonas euryale TaxID=1486919 RepID=A0A7R9V2D1_9CHLO|mmetsp:Transcript_14604/g.42701  ORF Transcript_14604/g.42701 Transcript_14604/m.42701 type:complete len:141 (+) Transcript_14604:263-685(+)
MPPPRLSSRPSDVLHTVVTRGIMGVLALGALTVVVDPGSVKSYDNEVEYARHNKQALRGREQHRCNDRVEDFVQAIAGEEGSIFRDFMPTARLLGRCLMSEPGREPADPYLLIGPWSPCYVDPAKRAQQQAATAAGGTSA